MALTQQGTIIDVDSINGSDVTGGDATYGAYATPQYAIDDFADLPTDGALFRYTGTFNLTAVRPIGDDHETT